MDEASTDYHTTLVESLINVNLTELYRVNEDLESRPLRHHDGVARQEEV